MRIRALLAMVALLGLAHLAGAQATGPSSQSAQAPKAAATTELSPAAAADMSKRVEALLRKMYAWGSAYEVKVGPIVSMPGAPLYTVPVDVIAGGQTDSAVVYVTSDGRYMIRGDIQDLNSDPLATTRQQLNLDGYASKGPANAKVVLVEFGDLECPSCRQLDTVFRQLLPQYPQVRLVFKDFPLEQIHPWAMTAAIASHCVLQKSTDAFWQFHDAVYDSQDLITPENAYAKLAELAAKAGADPDAFRLCMTDPNSKAPVEKSIDEGRRLQVNSTPTTFVDGRTVTGPDANLLQQYIEYDLAEQTAAKPAAPSTTRH
jgi:protein-disulfide isomerase